MTLVNFGLAPVDGLGGLASGRPGALTLHRRMANRSLETKAIHKP